MGKKVNKTIQLRESDIKRISGKVRSEAIDYSFILFLNVMRDCEGYGKKRLCRLYARINDLADSVSKGYCSLYDLEKVLFDEARIAMKGGRFDKSDNN